MTFTSSTPNIIDMDSGSITLTTTTPKYIELSITEALRVIEETVKFLNKKNDGLQQHIRTEKDKQNQKIVERMLHLAINGYGYSNTNSEAIMTNTVRGILREVTGKKDIKDIKP